MRKAILAILLAVMSNSATAEYFYLSCIYETPPYMRGSSIQLAIEDRSQIVMLGDSSFGESVSINTLRIAFRAKGLLIEVDRLTGRFMTTGDKFPANGACAVISKPKF